MKRFRKSVASASGRLPVVPAQAGADRSSSQDGDSGVILADLLEPPANVSMGPPCQACGAPRDGSNRFCASCGAPLAASDHPPVAAGRSGLNPTAVPSRVLQCKGCGAEVATSLDQRSYQCPFCDAAYVIELPPTEQRQRPEFIIGFAVSADQAKQKFHEWLGQNSWLRPGDLARQSFAEKQRGVYLPFWHFSMFARSRWAAQIGEYWYRTETYVTRDAQGRTQTRTRQVQETEWFPLQGEHQRYYFGFLVPATRGLSLEEARAVQPFQLSALVRYRPFYLAGWMSEEYSLDLESAATQARAEFVNRQQREIGRFLPGDTHRGLQVDTRIEMNGSDLILLPVHVLTYRYRQRVFHFLVNGQTGKVVGWKPWSTRRIAALVMLILLLLAVLVGVVILMTNRR